MALDWHIQLVQIIKASQEIINYPWEDNKHYKEEIKREFVKWLGKRGLLWEKEKK